MKIFKVLSIFVALFSFSQFVFADCPVALQCGQQLELNWSAVGAVGDCSVTAPGGLPISGTCSSSGWVSDGVPEVSGTYIFEATNQLNGAQLTASCPVTVPTNCSAPGTYDISAAPTPVQICSPATTGSSNISWVAPTGESVRVDVNGTLFTNGTGNGSQSANYISLGTTYTFSLYRTTGGANELKDTVTVSGTTDGCPAATSFKCSSNSCQACGGSTGVTCDSTGGSCTTAGESCVTSGCGDGTHNSMTEQCDDGNTVNGDGCSSSCTIEGVAATNDIGFGNPTGAGFAKTLTISQGTNAQVNWTSSGTGLSNCRVQRSTSGVWADNGWTGAAGSNTAVSWAVGTYPFRHICAQSSGGNLVSQTATLTVQSGPVATAAVGFNVVGNTITEPSKTITSPAAFATTLYYGVENVVANSCSVTESGTGTVVSAPTTSQQTFQSGSMAVPRSAGTAPFTRTYTMTCTRTSGGTITSNIATLNVSQTISCGDNICNGTETCGSCSQDCGVCAGTLDAACLTNPTVPTVRSGQQFTVNVPFTNTGSKIWNPSAATYTTRSSSSLSAWNNLTQTLGTVISGTPTSGIFTPSFSLTAPFVTSNTTYSLSFRMHENGVAFGSACNVNVSTGNTVTVTPPRCSDGVDNDIDGLADCTLGAEDPGCYPDGNGGGGACNPQDDDENDATGAVLRISANPQLVRQGGSSEISYEVSGCTSLNKGDPVTWELLRDGNSIGISGSETSDGEQKYPVTNIQNKTTFTLSCGGTVRSATVSVIKIGEF